MAKFTATEDLQDRYGQTIKAGKAFDDFAISGVIFNRAKDKGIVSPVIDVYTPLTDVLLEIPHTGGGAAGVETDSAAKGLIAEISKTSGTQIAIGDTTYNANKLWQNNTTNPITLPATINATTMKAAGFTEVESVVEKEILISTNANDFLTTATPPSGAKAGYHVATKTNYFVDNGKWVSEAAAAVSDTLTLASLPADTWTDVPASTTITNPLDITIRDASGQEIDLPQQKVGSKWQIRSSVALTNLTITVFS